MKKITRIITSTLVVVLASSILMACGGSKNGTEETGSTKADVVEIKIAHDNNVNTPIHEAYLKFEELVEKESDGKYDVVIFPGGQMGSVQDTFEQCKRGDLQMSASTTSNFTQTIPEFAVWESFYMFEDANHAKRVFESDFGKKMMSPIENVGLTGIGYMELGFRNFSNSKRAIEKASDLQGLKIRGYNPIQIAAWESLGVNTTSVNWNELFTSLQQKLIDGQECATNSFYTEKFYEAQEYWSLTKHVFTNFLWYANNEFMKSLPEEDREMIMKCAKEAIDCNWELANSMEDNTLKELEEKGIKVNEVSLEEREKMGKIMNGAIKDNIIAQCGQELYDECMVAVDECKK